MKTNRISSWLLIVGLVLCDHAALLAQPAPEPAVIVRDDQPTSDDPTSVEAKPWGKGTRLQDRLAAEQLFLEGNRLFRVPLFTQAAEQYTNALAKWQHPGFNFNLAISQLNLGLDVEARDNLERALRYGEEPLGAAQFREGQRQLRELERKLGRISITCRTRGAVVTLDGVTLFTGPGSYQGWTRATTHELAARGPDYLSESRQITVQAGATEQIDLKLVTLDEAADANRRWAAWKPWTVVAVGGAIAAGGGAFHFLSSRNADSYEKEFLRLGCASNDLEQPGCQEGQLPSDLNDRLSRARTQKKIAVGSYIAGGTVAAAGVVLLLLNRPRLEQRAQSSSGRRVSVVPTWSPDMLGVLVSVGP